MSTHHCSAVFCFVAKDSVGIVEKLSNVIKNNGGNWAESHLVTMAGLFSGLVKITTAQENLSSLEAALRNLSVVGVDIVRFETTDRDDDDSSFDRLDLIGPDRPGIVYELTRTLAAHGINIDTMATDVVSAAMSGEAMFVASIEFRLNNGVSEDAFYDAIDAVAEQLTLDISFNAEASE